MDKFNILWRNSRQRKLSIAKPQKIRYAGSMEDKKFKERAARAKILLRYLKKQYPHAKIALRYRSPMQLLVAVVLSAQCTDKKVNEVAATLFRKYKTVDDFARADQKTFEQEIKPTGFYRAKAKNIIAAARKIRDEFGRRIPRTMAEMVTIPGIGRKSANIILGNAYGIVDGIAVDTHVLRFAKICGLSDHDNPVKVEQDLMKLFSQKEWFSLTYRIIDHGRSSRSKTHKHEPCLLRDICGDPRF